MIWVKGLSVLKKESRITLGLPWSKKRMNNLLHADVGIQERRGQIEVANDFYTENSRRLSKFGHFSEVDLCWTFS